MPSLNVIWEFQINGISRLKTNQATAIAPGFAEGTLSLPPESSVKSKQTNQTPLKVASHDSECIGEIPS